MSINLQALPQGSRILVTGANGYIASQVIQTVLELGHKVRGSVRSQKPWLNELFETQFGKDAFETALITNFDDLDALDSAMKDVSGVIHVASDLTFSSNPEDVIPWVVRATQNVLAAAAKSSTVERFVLTSSSTAVLTPEPNKPSVVDEGTWNEEAVHLAWDPSTPSVERSYATYAASKVQGERAAWEWISHHKPNFIFNAVLPNFNTGHKLHAEISGSTMSWVRGLVRGDKTIFDRFVPQYYIDVGDTARLHAIALLAPEVAGQRIFAFAGPVNLTQIIDILRELRPDNKLIPDAPRNEGHDLTEVVPAKKSEGLLIAYFGQKGWKELRESIAAGIVDL